MKKIFSFLPEVIVEMKKVTWPTRQELIDSTQIVIVSAAIFGIYIAASDFVLSRFLGIIIQ